MGLPVPLLILSLIIEAVLVVHVIKTGRNQIWIWVLVLLPYVGIVAYLAAEIIPEIFRSRTAQRTARGFKKAMDPTADLRRYESEARVGSNVASRQRYAEELARHGRHDDAPPSPASTSTTRISCSASRGRSSRKATPWRHARHSTISFA
jgi:hypothetical protein